ncbi:hypothetical protein I6A84_34215 [Frankia sp. CNm7]|uniref:hypothetical protein n=1 Tax=Frankia nepalensis TaxID=1836974 RepID=UPI00193248CF|nr:hypothetical protein [Frankia nepalensis]MBL7523003.1 hypothetical protein [Frankia nepalensis]
MTRFDEPTAPGTASTGLADFEDGLRAAFTDTAREIHLPPAAGTAVVTRARRGTGVHGRGRWVAAGLATAAAVGLVAAGAAVVPRVTDGTREAATVMSGGTAPAAARAVVYGVSVGWLPADMVVLRDSAGAGRPVRAVWQTVRFGTPETPPPARVAHPADGPVFDVSVTVERGGAPFDPEQFVQELYGSANSGDLYAFTWELATVGGHPAGVYSLDWARPPTGTIWRVSWADGHGVLVSVEAADRATAQRIAESVVIGAAPAGPPSAGPR